MQYLTDFHHSPQQLSIRPAMPRSFYTAEQSTTTIFVSCFHTGIQAFFLFGPHARFLSQSAAPQLVAPPTYTTLVSTSSDPAPKSRPLPSRRNGHRFLLPTLPFSAFAQALTASAFYQHCIQSIRPKPCPLSVPSV